MLEKVIEIYHVRPRGIIQVAESIESERTTAVVEPDRIVEYPESLSV